MNLKKYSPQILTVLGIVGMIGTVVMAVKATPKCEQILEEAEERLREETKDEKATLDKKETAKYFVKAYWPVAAMGVVSTACFIASNYVSGKREAVMATALGVSEAALHRFQETTLETVGRNTMDEIKAKVADKHLAESKVDVSTEEKRNANVTRTKYGETLFYDPYLDRYFRSDLEHIRRCVNDLNERALSGDFIPLNDLYYLLDLNECKKGDDFGWHPYDGGDKVEIKYSARIADWGEPCIVLDYEVEPEYYSRNYL